MGNLDLHIFDTNLKQSIPKIYKRQFLEALLFGWIRGQVTLVPAVTLEQSIKGFYKESKINEDDWPLRDCLTTYHRMVKELYKSEQTKKPAQE